MAKQNLEKEVKRNWGKSYTICKRREDFRKKAEKAIKINLVSPRTTV
jgi:hypothetical protein